MINKILSALVQHERTFQGIVKNWVISLDFYHTVRQSPRKGYVRMREQLSHFESRSRGNRQVAHDQTERRSIPKHRATERNRSMTVLLALYRRYRVCPSIISSFADFDRSAITEKRKGQKQFFSLSASIIALIRSVIHEQSL